MTQETRREEALVRTLPPRLICHHVPRCPAATAPDHNAARTIAAHPEQGWSLLCNGVVVFDDYGELLPAGVPFPAVKPQIFLATAGGPPAA